MEKNEKQMVPKLRFPGFTDPWEQRKLGKLAEFTKGRGYSKADLIPYGDPIILYGRMYTDYELSISEVNTYAKRKNGTLVSKGGEVIVPASGETPEEIARAAAVLNKGIILGGDLNVIYPKDDLNSIFLAQEISIGKSQKKLAGKAQGKSVVHLHNSDLSDLDIEFPDLKEQEKISFLILQFNKLLTLHQR